MAAERPAPRIGVADLAIAAPLSLAIALLALCTKSFWGDEIRSIQFATEPLARALAEIAADCHPPLYFLVLRAWIAVCGSSELALRLFQALQGSLLLLSALLVFRRFVPERRFHPFWIALALSSELWLFTPMLRYYALAASLALLASHAFFAWLERPTPRRALALGALYVALLYTDYPSSFVAVLHLAVVLAVRRERLARFVAIGAAAGVAFLPWLGATISQVRSLQAGETVADLNASPASLLVKIAYSAYAYVVGEMTYPYEPIALAGVALLAVACVLALRELGWRRAGLPLALLAAVLAGTAFTGAITSFIAKRMSFVLTPSRTLYCLPIFYLAFAVAWSRLESRRTRALLLAPFLALALYGDANWLSNRHFIMPVWATPWKDVARSLRGQDGILLADESACLEYYIARMPGTYPTLIQPASLAELQAEVGPLARARGGLSVFWVALGRESTEPRLKSEITDYLAAHAALESEQKLLPIDPSYRRFKARISGRDTYDAKVTVRKYRLAAE